MSGNNIDQRRVTQLSDAEVRDGDYTLYWMQQSQRAECNQALEFALQRANENNTRLLVAFGITDDYPDANHRHFRFMLEGLQETASKLKERSIGFVIQKGDPAEVAIRLAKDACEVICDRGYLRHQVQWRRTVAKSVDCRVWQIEADVIVPVEVASEKQEYAARTIRKQLNDQLEQFIEDLRTTPINKDSRRIGIQGIDLSDVNQVLGDLEIARDVSPSDEFKGGTSHAKSRLDDFLSHSLGDYDGRTNIIEPSVSRLSPYLHFGQISPVQIASAVRSKRGHRTEAKTAFLEQLLVRRELTVNFVHYCSDYDSLNCLPQWASETLAKHEDDDREFHYTANELEAGQTHDRAWNAAMMEMRHRGYLHNHLRMYWGKKIIEWTNTTQHAYRTALDLNNKYFLDGRDANSYANVAWLFGLHDRAHQEREIFGKVRYMSADGLKRKMDVDGYIKSISDRYRIAIDGT